MEIVRPLNLPPQVPSDAPPDAPGQVPDKIHLHANGLHHEHAELHADHGSDYYYGLRMRLQLKDVGGAPPEVEGEE